MIQVVDYTDIAVHMKELMFIRITGCSDRDVDEIFKISNAFHVSVIDYSPTMVLIESVQTENRNNDWIDLLEKCCANRIEIARGGSVAIETLSIAER